MRIRQKKIVVADPRRPAALDRSAANGHVLPENVVVSRHQFHALTAERVVLRVSADYTKRMKHISGAKLRRSLHHRVLAQHASFSQFDARAHYCKCTHLHTLFQLRVWRDLSFWVNFAFAHLFAFGAGSRSAITQSILASAARFLSTNAFASILQRSPFHTRTFTSTRS